jgi:Fe-Mn family superoxide dismutase
MAPAKERGGNGGQLKEGPLRDAIIKCFGSYDSFVTEFNTNTAAVQGSGWGWLVSTLCYRGDIDNVNVAA